MDARLAGGEIMYVRYFGGILDRVSNLGRPQILKVIRAFLA